MVLLEGNVFIFVKFCVFSDSICYFYLHIVLFAHYSLSLQFKLKEDVLTSHNMYFVTDQINHAEINTIKELVKDKRF